MKKKPLAWGSGLPRQAKDGQDEIQDREDAVQDGQDEVQDGQGGASGHWARGLFFTAHNKKLGHEKKGPWLGDSKANIRPKMPKMKP